MVCHGRSLRALVFCAIWKCTPSCGVLTASRSRLTAQDRAINSCGHQAIAAGTISTCGLQRGHGKADFGAAPGHGDMASAASRSSRARWRSLLLDTPREAGSSRLVIRRVFGMAYRLATSTCSEGGAVSLRRCPGAAVPRRGLWAGGGVGAPLTNHLFPVCRLDVTRYAV